jgi:hypothetical protein
MRSLSAEWGIADMARMPLELPPDVAKAFVDDMRLFFAEDNVTRRDEIASPQLHALRQSRLPGEHKLRLHDVKEMFLQMRNHLD